LKVAVTLFAFEQGGEVIVRGKHCIDELLTIKS